MQPEQNFRAVLSQSDPLGTVLFVASIICLLMALQWGGSQYPWNDGRIIALLTVFGVLLIAWVVVQWREGDNATVPLHILRQRSVAFSTFYIFLGSASFVLLIYYLPIWWVLIILAILSVNVNYLINIEDKTGFSQSNKTLQINRASTAYQRC